MYFAIRCNRMTSCFKQAFCLEFDSLCRSLYRKIGAALVSLAHGHAMDGRVRKI